MGTSFTVMVVGTPDDALESRINELLEDVNDAMSTYQDDSEISRFNQSRSTEPFKVSEDFFYVMERSQEISSASGGALDMTLGPLINLWGFGTQGERRSVPADSQILAMRDYVGYEKIVLNDEALTVSKKDPRVVCSLSAIAKGFGVDKVAELLESQNITDYYVEIGGEVRVKGLNASNVPWRIGIAVPGYEGVDKIISLTNKSMATSGDYLNYFEDNGVRYSHTINAVTGKPITHNLASVTVLHESCAMADGYATAINVLGPEKGMALAERENLAVYMIIRSGDDFEKQMNAEFQRYFGNYSAEGK